MQGDIFFPQSKQISESAIEKTRFIKVIFVRFSINYIVDILNYIKNDQVVLKTTCCGGS
jgi:hypothetical protein